MNIAEFFNIMINKMGNTRAEQVVTVRLLFDMMTEINKEDIQSIIDEGVMENLVSKHLRILKDYENIATDHELMDKIIKRVPKPILVHLIREVIPQHLEETINIRSLRAILDNYLKYYYSYKQKRQGNKDYTGTWMEVSAKRLFLLIDVNYIVSIDKYPRLKKEIMRAMLK